MTESEYQEFLITIGYRYNKKSKSAFNSYEGFHTIIEFNEGESRYGLTLSAYPDNIENLKNKLNSFASENKDHITKAQYISKNKLIRINIKMTIDSEIDREHLKNTAKFIMDLCKSDTLIPLCRVCQRNRKTGLYVIGSVLTPVCENCIVRKRRQYEHRRDMFEKKKQNMAAGIFGAVFGAALGSSIYILLYQLNPFYGIWGGIIAPLSFGGFVLTGKRATRLSAVFCELISIFAFIAAQYVALITANSIMIENDGGGIAVREAVSLTNMTLTEHSYLNSIILELIVGISIMIITGIAYFLKRSLTRPLKISKNVL